MSRRATFAALAAVSIPFGLLTAAGASGASQVGSMAASSAAPSEAPATHPKPTPTPTPPCVRGKAAVTVSYNLGAGWAEVAPVDNACGDTVVTLASYRLLEAPAKFPQELVDAVSGLGRLEVEVPACGQVDLVLGEDAPGRLTGAHFGSKLIASWLSPGGACVTPAPSPTPTPTPTPSETPTVVPTPSATPTVPTVETPIPSGTPTLAPIPTPTPTSTPVVLPSSETSPASPSPVVTTTPSDTASASPVTTPVPTVQPTQTVVATVVPAPVRPAPPRTLPRPSRVPSATPTPRVSSTPTQAPVVRPMQRTAMTHLAHTGSANIFWIVFIAICLIGAGLCTYVLANRRRF